VIRAGTECGLLSSLTVYEVVDGKPLRRSILQGDEIVVTGVQITGWNTRIDFHVTKAYRQFVPPVTASDWTKAGGAYFADFQNPTWGKSPSEEEMRLKAVL
jgi:hypothetical protein